MKIKVANLKIGDIFEHKNVMYEVINIHKWSITCRYINNLYDKQIFASKYLYCDFSKYIEVEI